MVDQVCNHLCQELFVVGPTCLLARCLNKPAQLLFGQVITLGDRVTLTVIVIRDELVPITFEWLGRVEFKSSLSFGVWVDWSR